MNKQRIFRYYFGYKGIFKDINRINATLCIQRYWREFRYNPKYKLCERVMMRGLEEITNSKIKDDDTFSKKMRRKYFKKDLEITKRRLEGFEEKYSKTKNRIIIRGKRKLETNK